MASKTAVKKFLAPNEVADLLMVSTESVRLWSQKGWLQAETTPGGHRRYLRQNVERFARERSRNRDADDTRILIVDDDVQFAGYLKELLIEYHERIAVSVVNDGFSAGEQVHIFHPDIMLLDLMMPGLNGFEVCRRLKDDSATQSIRIIAMTGFPTEDNVQRIVNMGAECCLAKPLDTATLLEVVGLIPAKKPATQ